MSNRRKTIYIGIALVIYVAIIAFPTYLFTHDMLILRSIELGLRVGYLVFIILFTYFTKLAKSYTGSTKLKNVFLLLPIFFVAFINIFYLVVVRQSTYVYNPFNNDIFEILRFISIIITAVEVEILFRFIIQKNLTLSHKIVRILVTAAIYAATHFFVMLYSGLGVINPIDLLEVAFQFGIGVILGFLYEYTNNLVPAIAFNIIYSLSNQLLFKVTLSSNPHWSYYLTVSLFILYAAGYLSIFYFLMLKEESR